MVVSCGRAAAVLSLAGLVAAGCSKTQSAQARGRDAAAATVKVERVRQDTIHRAVEVVGTLAAEDEVTISSEADGLVSRIFHDLGDRVKGGEVLVELDREKPQYNLDQQKASLQRALAAYGAPDPEHLPPIEKTPDVQKASADLVQARQNFQRADELFKRQLVPKQALDDADAGLQSKQASYESALQNARNLRANIQATEAGMKLADRQLRDTFIRAPFDGFVEKRLVNLGQLVKAQSPVMAVVRMNPLRVTAELPEKMAPWISVGQAVELHVDAYPDRRSPGRSRASVPRSTPPRARSRSRRSSRTTTRC